MSALIHKLMLITLLFNRFGNFVSPESTTDDTYHCTENYMSSFDALEYMDYLTYEVYSNPYTLTAYIDSSYNYVNSKRQGYVLLSSAIALASLDVTDSNRDTAINKFYGYFNGWKTMCIKSKPPSCKSHMYCNDGNAFCFPGGQHDHNLSYVTGSRRFSDGDADAILGMIIAIKAIEQGGVLPKWYDKVRQWTDESITQFLADNTALSSSESHRILKLGSCIGGWDQTGNNPGNHSPGAYKAMRDYHVSYDGIRNYVMPSFGDDLSLEEKWNMLIETSYKFFGTAQCTDTGLVPNFALVEEVDSETLAKKSGSFSSPGSSQYEFGSAASQTMLRVALDALLYPDESSSAIDFLDPLHIKLRDGFNGSWNWKDNTLEVCEYVDSIYSAWRNSGLIFGPIYSTLAVQALSMTTSEQQTRVNAACSLVGNIQTTSFQSRSMQVLSMMVLNGDVAKIGNLLRIETDRPTASPTASPSNSAMPTSSAQCCSMDYKYCESFDPSEWCNIIQSNCNECGGLWISETTKDCMHLYGECSSSDDCCGPASCSSYGQCI